MRWVAIFDDNAGLDSFRKEHSAAHFDYLGANRDKIVIAGGLRQAPGEWYCGGLWVLEVNSRDEAVLSLEGGLAAWVALGFPVQAVQYPSQASDF